MSPMECANGYAVNDYEIGAEAGWGGRLVFLLGPTMIGTLAGSVRPRRDAESAKAEFKAR